VQKKLTYDEVFDRVASLTELATLSSTLTGIFQVTQSRGGTAKDLALIISKDPALSMKLLRTVNSCFYAFNRPIESIEEAAVMLGFTEVERLSLAISVINKFSTRSLRGRVLHQLWLHSLVCGIAAETVVDFFGIKNVEDDDVYLAALLHDVGKAIIWQAFPDAINPILHLMADQNLTDYHAEHAVLDGATHCVIGAWAAEQWNLPSSVVQGLQMHHAPREASAEETIVKVIHLADALCYQVGMPAVKITCANPPDRTASLQSLKNNEAFLKRFAERYEAKRAAIEAIVG
jgi:HD-like signal output (HDOD) protein